MKKLMIYLAICLFIIFMSPALKAAITFQFFIDNPLNISEGAVVVDSVYIDDSNSNNAPIVSISDSTQFTSAVIQTVSLPPDNVKRINFTVSPGYNDSGTGYGIVITGYEFDGSNPTDDTLVVNVTNTNRSPQFTNLPHTIIINENQTANFTITATDPDSDPLTLPQPSSPYELPANASFSDNGNGTGSFSYTPDYTQSGVDSVRFIANDNGSLADTAFLVLVVNNVNRAPVISNSDPSRIEIDEGGDSLLYINAVDNDNDPLSYNIVPSNTGWATITDSTVSLESVPYDIASASNPTDSVSFSVIVSDGSLADTITLRIVVSNQNRAPDFQEPSSNTTLTAYQADTSFIVFMATDADTIESDSIEYVDLDNIATVLPSQGWYISFSTNKDTLSYSPPFNFEGTVGTTFRFLARDIAGDADTIRLSFSSIDTLAPEIITSFDGSSSGQPSGKIRLSWTAPYEDHNSSASGPVNAYFIKYALSAPGNSADFNWWNNTAQYVQQQPPHPPASPGVQQSLVVNSLIEYQDYWFGILAKDASGDSSLYIRTGTINTKTQPPGFLFNQPDTTAPGLAVTITGFAYDSSGVLFSDSIRYSTDGSTWGAVDSVGPATDSSAVYISKFFSISLTMGSDNTPVYVRARDAQQYGYDTITVYVDTIPPPAPAVTSSPADSLTNSTDFAFGGTKEAGTTLWAFIELGSNPGSALQITVTGDLSSTWSDTISVYFQGPVHFRFYATDEAGNASDSTARLTYRIDTEPPAIVGAPTVTQFTNEQQVSTAVMNIIFNESLNTSTIQLTDFVIFIQDDTLDIDTLENDLIFFESSVRIDFSAEATGDFMNLFAQAETGYPKLSVSDSAFTDRAGNYNLYAAITLESNLNIISDTDFQGSTSFNPDSGSFMVSFNTDRISYFVFSIFNEQNSTVYRYIEDSLSAGSHLYTWDGTMNSGPSAGERAPDGWYKARLSARPYPVSPYDLPEEIVIFVDSYAPYESYFFPNSGSSSGSARIISSGLKFELSVGDTGAIGDNARAAVIAPSLRYLSAGAPDSSSIVFVQNDSLPELWEADLSSSPLAQGFYEMMLVIADSAANRSIYHKYFEVTAESGITGFLNYPNPFAPSVEQTAIAYVLGQAMNELVLEIYDPSGDLVFRKALESAELLEGPHEILWNGKSAWGKILNNGVYFARLTGDITSDFLKIAIADR